jgi:hypothetical protein
LAKMGIIEQNDIGTKIKSAKFAYSMDRSYEELRSEILQLDRETQGRLIDDIEEQWQSDIPDEIIEEATRRIEAYRRGEVGSVSPEESIARARKAIQDAIAARK